MIFKKYFFLLVIPILIIFTFWDLPKTFFQQDEWIAFRRMTWYEMIGGITNVLQLPFIFGKGHFTPLSYYQVYFEFKLFGLSFEPYAYISILTNIVNSLLLFYFAYLLLKNKLLAFLTSLLFSVNSISSQVVTWIAASANTQGAVLFLLLSLIFTFKYFQGSRKNDYYIGLILFFVGLLFKETVIFSFILAPFMWFIFMQKKNKKEFFSFLKPLVVLGLIYFLLRASLFLIPSPSGLEKVTTVNLSIASGIARVIVSPFKILPQALIPQQYLIDISDFATFHFFPNYLLHDGSINPYFSQTVVFSKVIPSLSIPIILITFIFYKLLLLKKESNLAKALIFSLIFIVLSALPYAFIPGDAADLPIHEPRNLHTAAVGTSLFLVISLWAVIKLLLKNNKYAYAGIFFLIAPLLLLHFHLNRTDVSRLVETSFDRRYILATIKKAYPRLPAKVIFYTESDTSYYGMPVEEKILPFQVSFGWTLLVWYQEDEKFPPCLFDFKPEAFHMLTQRYQECDGKGFGYFRDYDKLVKVLQENSLTEENVISYSWNGTSKKFKDTTSSIRLMLKEDLNK